VLTQGQYDCLMSLRLRFTIAVVPPTQASDGPVGGVFGYTHRTVSALLKHGLIRKSAGGGYTITDNGLHAVCMHKARD
jgi:predicted transcriptional regulator